MNIRKLKCWNFSNMLIMSLLLIICGFLVMAIDNSATGDMHSFNQLTFAPILLVLGYTLIIFAIMKRSEN